MKQAYILILAAALAAPAASAQLAITDSQLQVQLPLTVEKGAIGSDYCMQLTPALVCGTDTIALDSYAFRGARNLRQARREASFDHQPLQAGYRLGDAAECSAVFTRSQYPQLWQQPVSLVVLREKSGCCSAETLSPIAMATAEWVETFEPAYSLVADNTGAAGSLQLSNPVLTHISDYKPYDSARPLRREKGAMYVHFPLNVDVISTDFRDNAATLDRIVDITRKILADSASEVKLIQIVGLASVEGSVKRNNTLAGNRANALKEYVQARVAVPDTLFEVNNGGEAWAELRDQLAESDFDGAQALIDIIDNTPDVDVRERKMRRLQGGKPYAYLRKHVLGDQRNSGYIHIYYDYVPDLAAADINAASQLLAQERWEEALALLLPWQADPRSWNALGVALYMTGDKDAAKEYWRRAAAQGNADAARNLQCAK